MSTYKRNKTRTRLLMTVINYSAGGPSERMVREVIYGEVSRPENLIVLNADPGMENTESYKFVARMKEDCIAASIPFETAPGPNLYKDLVSLTVNKKRVDNPPYWVVAEDGKIGRLRQECTSAYKIAPMDVVLRKWLTAFHPNISLKSRNIPGHVEKWIGFTWDEIQRSSEPTQKYVRFRYPFIERKISKSDMPAWYMSHGLPLPPRSVCNACYGQGLDSLREMFLHRPGDWSQAVTVDDAVRHGLPGVKGEVFVSPTCLPLRVLAEQKFVLSPKQLEALKNKRKPDMETLFMPPPSAPDVTDDRLVEWACDSGMCFR